MKANIFSPHTPLKSSAHWWTDWCDFELFCDAVNAFRYLAIEQAAATNVQHFAILSFVHFEPHKQFIEWIFY